MSLSIPEREKLLNTLQKTFPLAAQWAKIKESKNFFCKTEGDWIAVPMGVLLTGALCVGSFYLADLGSSSESGIIHLLSFLSFCFGTLLSIATVILSGFGIASLHHAYKIKKMKNKPNEYRKEMRDYICEKTSLRYVQAMLPNLSDSDLKLLSKHPDLNSVFQKCFEKEADRREKVDTINKINSDFLLPVVAVESDLSQQNVKQSAYENLGKVNL